jgi:hypothetical protein
MGWDALRDRDGTGCLSGPSPAKRQELLPHSARKAVPKTCTAARDTRFDRAVNPFHITSRDHPGRRDDMGISALPRRQGEQTATRRRTPASSSPERFRGNTATVRPGAARVVMSCGREIATSFATPLPPRPTPSPRVATGALSATRRCWRAQFAPSSRRMHRKRRGMRRRR